MIEVFGRTNVKVPDLWFGILGDCDHESVVMEVSREPSVLDVSGGAGRFGHLVSGLDVQICTFGGRELERATGAGHAADLIGAHLVETLSGVGRSCVDFYLLRLRSRLSEEVINGALVALDDAKTDGAVRFIGLYAEGGWEDIQPIWQFHDGFEFVMADNNPRRRADFESVVGFARGLRCGVASCHCLNWGDGRAFFEGSGGGFEGVGAGVLKYALGSGPVLVGVKSADEVRECRTARRAVAIDPRSLGLAGAR